MGALLQERVKKKSVITRKYDFIINLIDQGSRIDSIPNKFQKAGSGEPIGLNLSLTRRLKH
jgi:hypothetical protein